MVKITTIVWKVINIGTIGIAAVQLNIKEINSVEEYIENIDNIVKDAKGDNIDLILLPQYTGVLLKTLSKEYKGFKEFIRSLDKDNFVYLHSEIAKKYDIFLTCGTNIESENGRIYNCGYLLSNYGDVLIKQKQTHLTKTEIFLGMSRGESIEVKETGLGKIGIVIGIDKYYPEVSRIIALLGGDIVLNPSGEFIKYNTYRQIGGMWQEVQQNQFLALESSFIGKILDKEIDGRACIYAPCELTKGFTGFLTKIKKDNKLVKAKIDIKDLDKARKKFPIFEQFNISLYKKYFPLIYK